MACFKLTIPLLCIIVLAAHFLRERNFALLLISLLSAPFVFVRKRWAVRGMQLFFILASFEWIRTTVVLAMERKVLGLPWMRMAVILGSVALLTLTSARIVNRTDLNR